MARSLSSRTAGAAGLLEPPLEALDAAARVDELLLARVERVALRADLDVQLGLVERVTNVFPHEQCTVDRTYSGWMSAFIGRARIPEAVCAATLPPLTITTGRSAFTLPAEERRGGGRAGRLARELGPLVEEAERVLDLLLGDEHALEVAAQLDRERAARTARSGRRRSTAARPGRDAPAASAA